LHKVKPVGFLNLDQNILRMKKTEQRLPLIIELPLFLAHQKRLNELARSADQVGGPDPENLKKPELQKFSWPDQRGDHVPDQSTSAKACKQQVTTDKK